MSDYPVSQPELFPHGEPPHDPAAPPDQTPAQRATPPAPAQGMLALMREWFDALIIAFILAMFIRVFLIELFKIPTGSMTPTLIGGRVSWLDYNQDGKTDLILYQKGQAPLLFLNNGKRLIAQGRANLSPGSHPYVVQSDRILVNKFAYWFHSPRRGDIVVFKVPRRIWKADKPIYIKRLVGEPGDVLSFSLDGRLIANGHRVDEPPFFQTQHYDPQISRWEANVFRMDEIVYDETNLSTWTIQSIHVPPGEVYVFGDNTDSSWDSRYWGGVPLNHIKGKAFFRYWPLDQMKFLREG